MKNDQIATRGKIPKFFALLVASSQCAWIARPVPHPTNTHCLPTSSLSCSTVGGTSCLLLVSWHPYRPIMSRVIPPNQVPLRPHYSHFYLLHTAAVHHLMMLDPATDGATQAGSCSLSGCTSNQAPFLNSRTLKCYVSILFFHWLVYLFPL